MVVVEDEERNTKFLEKSNKGSFQKRQTQDLFRAINPDLKRMSFRVKASQDGLKNTEAMCLVDTGAQVNVVRRDLVKQQGWEVHRGSSLNYGWPTELSLTAETECGYPFTRIFGGDVANLWSPISPKILYLDCPGFVMFALPP